MNESTKGNTDRKGEGNMYDKIMRENLVDLFLPLVAEHLNFTIKSFSPLPDKQPTTLIRETDSFLLIETDSKVKPKLILHLEFERRNNSKMIYRMAEYHGIELRKYELPIEHVVVYLGEATPTMRTKLDPNEVFEGFTLINVHDTDPQNWLAEKAPERIIMAVLSSYHKENAIEIIVAILTKLRKVCKTDEELKRFIKQLTILSRMRKLEELTIKLTEAMPISIDIKEDYLYKLGLQENYKSRRESEVKAAKAEAKAIIAETRAAVAEVKASKAKQEIKVAISTMLASGRFTNEQIIDLMGFEPATFYTYLQEIEEEKE